eukprot:1730919-Amphidinium_carterae.1
MLLVLSRSRSGSPFPAVHRSDARDEIYCALVEGRQDYHQTGLAVYLIPTQSNQPQGSTAKRRRELPLFYVRNDGNALPSFPTCLNGVIAEVVSANAHISHAGHS